MRTSCPWGTPCPLRLSPRCPGCALNASIRLQVGHLLVSRWVEAWMTTRPSQPSQGRVAPWSSCLHFDSARLSKAEFLTARVEAIYVAFKRQANNRPDWKIKSPQNRGDLPTNQRRMVESRVGDEPRRERRSRQDWLTILFNQPTRISGPKRTTS